MFIRQLVENAAARFCAATNEKYGAEICQHIPKEYTREEVLRILHNADFDGALKDSYTEYLRRAK
jgi:hypothetical protein